MPLTNYAFADLITFTRSTTGTFVGVDSLLQTAAINAPRFDYDPVTAAPLGLLIEEQRVNLVLYSEQFDNAAWTKSLSSVAANATPSPDGTTNADRITADGSSNPHTVQQNVTYTAAAHTLTVYAKRDTNNFVQLRFGATAVSAGTGFANFDLNAGTVGTIGAGLSAASITPAGNGWYRCTITATTFAATSNLGFYIVTSATAVSSEVNTLTTSVFLYGAQLEAGSFATSYIPTVASTVTRAADIAVMTGTNFSSWYNQNEGTMVASWATTSVVVPNALGVFGVSDATANGRAQIRRSNTANDANFIVVNGGVVQYNGTITASSGINTSALAYKVNDFIGANNGTLGAADTSGTLPTPTQAEIGFGQGLTYLNGHIRTFTFYPSRLSNAQLQALSA